MLRANRSARLLADGVVFALLFTCIAGCQCGKAAKHDSGAAMRPAAINHVVFSKLKDPADAGALIADCDAQLASLPMITAYFCGRHLDTGRGDRVDADYDVGLYVGFTNEADYAAYVDHPSHKALVAKWQPRWEWIRILDVYDPTP